MRSSDAYGNQAVADDNGAPFAFRTWDIPGLFWRETFEGATTGWTLQGEWEIGAPQGKGGLTTGFPDPTAAYNNGKILGHDLTGRGASPGDYEKGQPEKATSPTQNAGGWRNSKLIVHRKLNAGIGDEASLWVCASGTCTAAFRTGSLEVADADYGRFAYDISGSADGKSSVRLEFRQNAAFGSASGWNVDDVIIKNGALPDYAACGHCGQAPSFAGATGAADNDACGANGVTVSWSPAVAWGTGASGTYSVYRGTAPGFAADAAHRVASGVSTLSYSDAGAPAGTLYYLVRAENGETCSSGPANGGVTDANTAYVAVVQTTTQPVPATVTTLGVQLVNHVHVRLAWTAVAGASSFRIYRSATPLPGGFAPLAATGTTLYDDLGQGNAPGSAFYLVRGVNACGQEGP